MGVVLFTNELMQPIKRYHMFPADEDRSKCALLRVHELATSIPHLCTHGSYLRTEWTSNGMFREVGYAEVTNLLFNVPINLQRC